MFSFIGADTHIALLIGILLMGFVALVYGADWLVNGASGMAKRFNVSDLVIGLTVVAFGTSMPELVVNIIAATSPEPNDLALTNVLGSNIINIFVILGLTALIYPVSSKVQTRKVDIPMAFGGSLLLLLFALFTFDTDNGWEQWKGFSRVQPGENCIGAIGGSIFLLFFIGYLVYLFKHAKTAPTQEETVRPMAIWKAVLLIVAGVAGLAIGGESIVKSATEVAHRLGVGDAIIGLTVVALGTSLPELATSCVAAMKHNSDLALGNCIGSCTFNIFFVLAISGIISPLKAYDGLLIDASISLFAAFLVGFFALNDKRKEISRLEGALLLLVYAAYMAYRLLTL